MTQTNQPIKSANQISKIFAILIFSCLFSHARELDVSKYSSKLRRFIGDVAYRLGSDLIDVWKRNAVKLAKIGSGGFKAVGVEDVAEQLA
ncbi:MAG: hypothetical protein ACI9SQ_001380 [Rubritalea sp.]|jgi:hypothetical protein